MCWGNSPHRNKSIADDALLEWLRDRWLPRLTSVQSDPEPQARAAIGRALGQLNLDNRKGVGVSDGLPDLDWVEIPGGEFQYGAEKQADDPAWFEPARPQRLSLPTFWISRFPVTNAQFQTFLDDNPSGYERWFDGLAASEDERRIREPYRNFPNHPRESVNWYQAIAFCRWLSWHKGGGTELQRMDEWAVRLPTEFEWERAARGTKGLVYPYGNEFDPRKGNVYETGIGQTSAVGIFPDGAWPDKVQDMSGNVWEWCLSEFEKPKLEAHKENLETNKPRVLRGGSWDNDLVNARAACRYHFHPAIRYNFLGFRMIMLRPPSL
jgi:formylglycine-generating enzyme required for sulfatase activity